MMYYYSSRDRAEDPESNDRLLGQSGGDEPNPNGDAWKGAGRLGLQLMQIGYQVQLLALLLGISVGAPVYHVCCRTKRATYN